MKNFWIQTRDGSFTLRNTEHGETYHSTAGAWSECAHVFLNPFLEHAKLHPRSTWRILDLGFGLGLNWLCVVNHFLGQPPSLGGQARIAPTIEIISIERDPAILDVQVTREQLGDFVLSNEALELLQYYKMYRKVDHAQIKAELLVGDAVDIMNKMDGQFDVIFHDAFSPQKNPECWTPEFFKKIAACSNVGTEMGVCHTPLLLTYSVARSVREALQAAGFNIKKCKGFGGKRERLEALLKNKPIKHLRNQIPITIRAVR